MLIKDGNVHRVLLDAMFLAVFAHVCADAALPSEPNHPERVKGFDPGNRGYDWSAPWSTSDPRKFFPVYKSGPLSIWLGVVYGGVVVVTLSVPMSSGSAFLWRKSILPSWILVGMAILLASVQFLYYGIIFNRP